MTGAALSPSSARLLALLGAEEMRVVGLMSGTSADGVDAALCRVPREGRVLLERYETFPYPPALRRKLLALQGVKELCELNFTVGEAFAAAALGVCERAGVEMARVDLIGSHGQTVYHLPPYLAGTPSTLQIGEAAVIAERTGRPVVSDFRVRDVAAGGQGAPLVPWADFRLFHAPGRVRALQNIGGMANVTVVGERVEDVIAFDTGPGNVLLDAIAARATSGADRCDRDGSLSAKGVVIPELLAELLAHPFLALPPPRSTGREVFGEPLAEELWQRHGRRAHDLLATLARFTAECIARAYRAHVLPRTRLDEVYVSGGGARNPTVMRELQSLLAPLPVLPLAALGMPEGAREPAAFALLAAACVRGEPGNLPQATGARAAAVLGKITP